MVSRRARAITLEPLARASTYPGLALGFGVLIWGCTIVAFPKLAIDAPNLIIVSRIGAAELFVIAGFTCLARWLLIRHAAAMRTAIGLVAIGCLVLPALAVLEPSTPDGLHVEPRPALLRVAILALLSLIVTQRRPVAGGHDRARVRRRLVIAFATVAGAALIAILVGPLATKVTVRALAVVAELLAAVTFTLLARQRRRIADRRSDQWFAVGLALMSGNELVNAISMNGLLPLAGVGAGVQLAAAVAVTCAAVADLRSTYGVQRTRSDELSVALATTKRQLVFVEQEHRERIHDARSALVGVIGASRLVAGAPAAEAIDAITLQQMIAAELERLHQVLAGALTQAPTDFELDDVLAPVLVSHRVNGLVVHADELTARVHGCPAATATVFDNLLRNARLHAPSSVVEIAVRRDGGMISVDVRDHGPGIAAAERAAVLLPGVRGTTASAPGSGLGLHNAAASMAAQFGDLSLREPDGGGLCVTVTLPAAPLAQIAPAARGALSAPVDALRRSPS